MNTQTWFFSSNRMALAETRFRQKAQWAFCHLGRVVPQINPRPETRISIPKGIKVFWVNPKWSHKRLEPIKTARNQRRKNFPQGTRFKKEAISIYSIPPHCRPGLSSGQSRPSPLKNGSLPHLWSWPVPPPYPHPPHSNG